MNCIFFIHLYYDLSIVPNKRQKRLYSRPHRSKLHRWSELVHSWVVGGSVLEFPTTLRLQLEADALFVPPLDLIISPVHSRLDMTATRLDICFLPSLPFCLSLSILAYCLMIVHQTQIANEAAAVNLTADFMKEPTECFTNLEPSNPSMDVSWPHKIRLSRL